MPPRQYQFQLKSTGKTYTMPWEDDDNEPSSLDKKQFAWEQDNPTTGKRIKDTAGKAWDWANEPLTDLPSRVGKYLADKQDQPRIPDTVPRRSRTGAMYTGNPESEAATRGFTAGATEGLGNVASSLTSPLSAGLAALSGGASVAAKTGAIGTASALRAAETGVNAGLAAHGTYKAGKGAYEGNLGDVGAGALEIAGGVAGMHGARAPDEAGFTGSQTRTRPTSEQPPRRPGLGTGRTFTGPGDGDIIDADFRVANEGQMGGAPTPTGLPAINERGLPPARPTYYGGPGGMSTEMGDVTQGPRTFMGKQQPPPVRNWSDAAARMREGRPDMGVQEVAPQPQNPRDILEQNSPYGMNYLRKDGLGDVGEIGQQAPPPPRKPQAAPAPQPKAGPYAKVSDTDVAYLADQGDAIAREEALRRPSLRSRFPGAGAEAIKPDPVEKVRGIFDSLKNEEGSWKPWGSGKKAPPRDEGFQGQFADWVNERRATKVEGILKKKEFKDLDQKGIDGILDFQAGVRDGRLADVQSYFDTKYAELDKAGVRSGFRENYLPQLWEDDPNVVKNVYRKLGLKPSFTMERVLENYQAGLDAGLKPKFTTMSDLLGWYEGKANKAMSDRRFYDYLRDENLLKPKGQAPPDWETLNPDHFPSQKFKSKGKIIEMVMQAPPEVAHMVNNYLKVPASEMNWRNPGAAMQWMGDKASLAKNLTMTAGIPGTAINAHGANIFARTVMGNPKEAFRAGKYILNPKSAGRELDAMMPTAPFAVKHGLTLSTEGHELGTVGSTNLAGKAFQGFLKKQGKMFEDPLFQNVIPALKLKHFNDMHADLVKTGLPSKEAGHQAAEFVNNLYGGINWEAMGRSRDLGNLFRMTVLAPDWLATNVNLGKGMAKALLDPTNPQGRAYAKMARNTIAAYVAADVVNYNSAGHHMWENDSGHTLDIDLGTTSNGKKRWLRSFGTAADFARLPFDAVSAVLGKGDLGTSSDIIKNRLSVPLRAGADIIFKRDRMNRPMLGKDDYGRQIPMKQQVGSLLGEVGSVVTPPYVQSGIDYATGRIGGEEALTSMGELPFRYSHTQKKSKTRRGRR